MAAMKHDPQALQQIVGRTLDHYQARAEAFREGARDHDVEQNIEVLPRHVQAVPSFTLLDFGCGPGCDYPAAAGFVELEHYYRPAGLPREQQSRLSGVWRREERL